MSKSTLDEKIFYMLNVCVLTAHPTCIHYNTKKKRKVQSFYIATLLVQFILDDMCYFFFLLSLSYYLTTFFVVLWERSCMTSIKAAYLTGGNNVPPLLVASVCTGLLFRHILYQRFIIFALQLVQLVQKKQHNFHLKMPQIHNDI